MKLSTQRSVRINSSGRGARMTFRTVAFGYLTGGFGRSIFHGSGKAS